MKQVGRAMRHFGDNVFHGEYSLLGKLPHSYDGVLHQWAAGCGMKAVAFLFGGEMGGVVGGDNVDQAVGKGVAEGGAVGG